MGQKTPKVTTLGKKTLEPFYKYIVNGSPKIPFSHFSFCEYVRTPLLSGIHTPFFHYLVTIPFPHCTLRHSLHPPGDHQRTSLWRGGPLPNMAMVAHLTRNEVYFCLFVFVQLSRCILKKRQKYLLCVANLFCCFIFT